MRYGTPIHPSEITRGMEISPEPELPGHKKTTRVTDVEKYPKTMQRECVHVNRDQCYTTHAYVY